MVLVFQNPKEVTLNKSLFTETLRYTDDAAQLDYAGIEALRPLFATYIAYGFTARDISHVLHLSVTDLELEFILKSNDDDN